MSVIKNLNDSEETRIKKAGKHVMQAMVLQCQSLYTSGMTETAFIEAVYGNISAASRTTEGVNFFKQVYEHLVENRSWSDVYTAETGDVTYAVYQKALSYRDASPNNLFLATSAFLTVTPERIVPILVIIILIIAIILASATPAR